MKLSKKEDWRRGDLWGEPCVHVIHDEKETLTPMERIIFLPDQGLQQSCLESTFVSASFRALGDKDIPPSPLAGPASLAVQVRAQIWPQDFAVADESSCVCCGHRPALAPCGEEPAGAAGGACVQL